MQTEDYARTILAANPEAPDEDQLSARVAAQTQATGNPHPR